MKCANGIKLGNIADIGSDYHMARNSNRSDWSNRNGMEKFKVLRD